MLTRKIRLLRRISKAVEAVCKWNGMIFNIMEFRIFKNRRLKMRKKIVNSLDVEKSKLVNNTSKIMDSVNELERCMK